MLHVANVPLEDSIAQTLGALYEKNPRGAMLMRVLEDYRRFCSKNTDRPLTRSWKAVSHDAPSPSKQELERLYLRRAAVDQVIRSIEAYSSSPISFQSHR